MIEVKRKQLLVFALATVIMLTWGFAGYRYFNPAPSYLGESDTIAVEWMLSNMCPELVDGIEYFEGKMEIRSATKIVDECNTRMYSQSFEEALIEEFSKQQHR